MNGGASAYCLRRLPFVTLPRCNIGGGCQYSRCVSSWHLRCLSSRKSLCDLLLLPCMVLPISVAVCQQVVRWVFFWVPDLRVLCLFSPPESLSTSWFGTDILQYFLLLPVLWLLLFLLPILRLASLALALCGGFCAWFPLATWPPLHRAVWMVWILLSLI